MNEIIQSIVDFLQANGIEGWIEIGGVTFHYLSLAFGAIVGFIIGWITG